MSSASASSSSSSSSSSAAPKQRKYRFYREDFGKLEVRPCHVDLTFDITATRVHVTARTTFFYQPSSSSPSPLTSLSLNSKDLEIRSVSLLPSFQPLPLPIPSTDLSVNLKNDFAHHVASFGTERQALPFELDNDEHLLKITFPTPIVPNQQFVLQTETIATPTAHILEGLYFDYTPSAQPQTIITQCQQYGFQRIVPCVDTMTAKAFYSVTIIADKRYTNTITNGDLAPGYVDSHFSPIYHPAPATSSLTDLPADIQRHQLRYVNHRVPMAPYLFFLGVGSYVTYRKELEYPSGQTCELQLLCFPGLVQDHHARTAIQSLYDSVLWVHLFCGPEAYDHPEEQKQILALIKERDALKEKHSGGGLSSDETSRLSTIRAELRKLISVWKQTGHTYSGQFYREIAMQNSDYGGMENVGNTTIISSRLVPSDLVTDAAYLYMEAVKVHEFYHDINGSQVTGQSPFEIWLNEAVTVHIERARSANLFGADFNRLRDVVSAFIPGQGALATDRSPNALAVEPEGFNRTQELISGMTYFKAPEFVRMIELVMGKPAFMRGLAHYYNKFAFSNATTEDWIESMEAVSGLQLKSMRTKWLKRTGFPDVTYRSSYDAGSHTFTVSMKQTGFSDNTPYEIPVSWALVKDGRNIREGLFLFTKEQDQLVVRDVAEKPDFLSFARDWSFYGTSKNESATIGELVLQARTDPDTVNRYFAYRHVADIEKANIIRALISGSNSYNIGADFVTLHGSILFDESLTPSCRALILKEAEDISMFPDLAHYYQAISDARDALLQAVYDTHAARIVELYQKLQSVNRPGPHKDQLHERALKHHLFAIIAAGNVKKTVLSTRTPSAVKVDVSELASALIESSFMSDKLFGFAQFLQGPASIEEKNRVKAVVRDRFKSHPDSIEAYIMIVGGLDSDVAPTYIRELVNDSSVFNLNLSGHQRGLARGWSMLRKRSLLTAEGRDLLLELFLKIGKTNQYSAQSFIHAFSDFAKFTGDTKAALATTLEKMKAGLDAKQHQSLYNQINATLAAK